jgi:hypothetical protein
MDLDEPEAIRAAFNENRTLVLAVCENDSARALEFVGHVSLS